MALLINNDEVKALLDFDETLEAIEDAYIQYGNNQVVNPIRRGMRTDRIEDNEHPHDDPDYKGLGMNFAYSDKYKIAAVKILTVYDGMKILTHLIDTDAGRTLAIFHSTWESYVRSGAAGAVGTKLLARKAVPTLGMIGTGICARLLLDFHVKVRNFEKVYCHNGRIENNESAKIFAEEMRKKYDLEIIATETIREVVEEADVLVSATRATSAIIKADWIKPGTHITGIGADTPLKAEYEPAVFGKINKLIIDYGLALKTRQMKDAFAAGVIREEDIYGHIGEIAAGKKPGRTTDSEITAFISTGMTIGYVMILKKIYDKAIEKGLGLNIDKMKIDPRIRDYFFLLNE